MNTTTEDMLAKLGLQPRMSMRNYLLPGIGVFGLGMLAGAGIIIFAVPGVRRQLRDRLRRGAAKVQEVAEDVTDEAKERLGKGGQTTDLSSNSKSHSSSAADKSNPSSVADKSHPSSMGDKSHPSAAGDVSRH